MKDYLKKIRFNGKYLCINRVLDLLTEKGKRELASPRLVDKLPFRKVLIFSPHPDDDVLGCGGAIIKHKMAGDEVDVVCMTDGSRGNLDCEKDESLIESRREEMTRAHKILDVDRAYYLDYEDGKLSPGDAVVDRVTEIIGETSPEAVYTPFFVDYHKDHFETSRILSSAIEKAGFKGKWVAYEVNSPLFPNTVLDITDCIERKIEAVKSFESQLSVNNYIHTIIEGLNRFRTNGVMLGKGYGEGFYITEVEFYRHLLTCYFNENSK